VWCLRASAISEVLRWRSWLALSSGQFGGAAVSVLADSAVPYILVVEK
jgi:hypothetical protein